MKRTFLNCVFFAVLLLVAPPLYADHSVNINTADKAALMTLNGIGDVKAKAIIDYREANGPFSKIEDIMNVSGIGTATFNNIKSHITIEDVPVQSAAPQEQGQQTELQASPGASAAPQARITARILGEGRSIVGAGSFFKAEARDLKDELLGSSVRYIWNFGDGATAEGERVFHAYSYPGKYVVLLTAAQGYSSVSDRLNVNAVAGQAIFAAEGDGSLTIYNKSDQEINIGLWTIVQGPDVFTIPENTFVFGGEGVRFSSNVTRINGTPDAKLFYPNGTLAMGASAGASSPLRGERVSTASRRAASEKSSGVLASPDKTDAKLAPDFSQQPASSLDQLSAAAESGANLPLWLSLGGLAVVLALGVTGAWYGRKPDMQATGITAGEFEIS